MLAKNMSGISEGGGKPGELTKEILAFDKAFGTGPNAELIRRALEKKGAKEGVNRSQLIPFTAFVSVAYRSKLFRRRSSVLPAVSEASRKLRIVVFAKV